jgi:hypothetical protein
VNGSSRTLSEGYLCASSNEDGERTGREDRDVGRARGESRAETSATWKEPTF